MSYRQSSDGYPRKNCMGEGCALYDQHVDGCLIRTFLITQIEKNDIVIPFKKEEKDNEIERIVHLRSGN
jgi:hypothetical protein